MRGQGAIRRLKIKVLSDFHIVEDTYIFRIVGRRLRLFRPTCLTTFYNALYIFNDHKLTVLFISLKVDDFRPMPVQSLLSQNETKKVFFHLLESFKTTFKNRELSDQYFVFPKNMEEITELRSNCIEWIFALNGYVEVTAPEHTFITPSPTTIY